MTEKDFKLKNTVIAKFMGAIVICEYLDENKEPEHLLLDFINKDNYPENSRYHSTNCLKYHKSFDWLMPVVYRIYDVSPNYNETTYSEEKENAYRIFDVTIVLPIEIIYSFVIRYIEWYNDNIK